MKTAGVFEMVDKHVTGVMQFGAAGVGMPAEDKIAMLKPETPELTAGNYTSVKERLEPRTPSQATAGAARTLVSRSDVLLLLVPLVYC